MVRIIPLHLPFQKENTNTHQTPQNHPSSILSTIPLREDPRDVLVMKSHSPYNSLHQLPPGSIIGTSSIRRKAQIAHFYPQLKCLEIRGNLQTRLWKLDDAAADVAAGDDESSSSKQNYDCLILAAAGLKRMGLEGRISEYLSSQNNNNTTTNSVKENNFLHAPGQGALGLEIRHSDPRILKLLSPLNHIPTAITCSAERSFLKELHGGCSAPVGVESRWDENTGVLELRGQVLSVGEREKKEIVEERICEVVGTVEEAEGVGERLARRLIGLGADRILGRVG